jgi:hypothetical protein
MAQQQQQHKFYPCRKGCGTQITFDNAHKSQSGKFIPLEKDSIGQQLQAHQCQNNKEAVRQEQQQQQVQQQQQQQLPTTAMTEKKPLEIMKEIQAIKAHLLGLVSRLDRLEQELQK